MSNDNVNAHGRVGIAKPTAAYDGTEADLRLTRFGEQYTRAIGKDGRHALSSQGSYFVAHSPTIDVATTTVGHAAPVLVDADDTLTKPLIHLMHGGSTSSIIKAHLDYIRIEVIVAGASGTSDHWTAQLDTGATRYSSGTVETLTTVNPNMTDTSTPLLVAKAGPFVAGAESANVRRLGHGTFKSTIEIAGDVYLFDFGGDPRPANKVSAAATTFTVPMAPVILGPTDQFLLALWQVAQNAAGIYKITCAWWEL